MSGSIDPRELLADPAQAGAYFIDARDARALADAAAELEFAVARVDFAGCADKDDALTRIAAGLRFPAWFGHNWDALNDCVNDLSWWPAPGYLLLIEHAGPWQAEHGEDAATLVEILNDAAQDWAKSRIAFWALLPLPQAELEQMAP
ncbi:barstar family protein [Lysobacter sp. Hz 25]|uniref:barstar family protein n=1 Tax=Lysobacter sp. Hz 25 TaxID=3383698 RepID=UPI0038D4BABD